MVGFAGTLARLSGSWPGNGRVRCWKGICALIIVHVYISIPPKYAAVQVLGYIKGRSAIHIARMFAGRVRNFTGENFWARGYFASTVGRDEEVIRNYNRNQEQEDLRLDQLKLLS